MVTWWLALIIGLVPSVVALLTAIVITNKQTKAAKERDGRQFLFQKELAREKSENDKKKDIYLRRRQNLSMIRGFRHQMMQLRVSYYGALTNFAYYNELQRRTINRKNKEINIREAHTWQHQALELELEIAKNQYKLIETIGLIQSVSSENKDAMELCGQINDFRWPPASRPPQSAEENLESWRTDQFNAQQQFVERNYGELLNKLSEVLLSELLSEFSTQ